MTRNGGATSGSDARRTPRGTGSGSSPTRRFWFRFKQHRLGVVGLVTLVLLYCMAVFAPFLAPYGLQTRHSGYVYAPPHVVRLIDDDGRLRRPFVYGLERQMDARTFRTSYVEDRDRMYAVSLFVRGERYRLLGAIESDVHLFGVAEGRVFLFGTDRLGRDLFSRALYGARISLSVGLVGVFLTMVLGTLLGITSGYLGGFADRGIQRLSEVLMAIPSIPLWMALGAAVPPDWPAVRTYFAVTIILAVIGWVPLSRQVRGRVLALRGQEYVEAARAVGASHARIIMRHILPNIVNHTLIITTLAIPQMILAETALSFLGLGLRPPITSWGVLLSEAQRIETLVHHAWLLIPTFFIVVTVLAFNFFGDALRDALNP